MGKAEFKAERACRAGTLACGAEGGEPGEQAWDVLTCLLTFNICAPPALNRVVSSCKRALVTFVLGLLWTFIRFFKRMNHLIFCLLVTNKEYISIELFFNVVFRNFSYIFGLRDLHILCLGRVSRGTGAGGEGEPLIITVNTHSQQS